MIACTDVHYGENRAVAACLLFRDWRDDRPCHEVTRDLECPAAYKPGRFYRRELPALLSVLATLPKMPGAILIDGYVWLGDESHAGLGAYLYEALGKTTPVIGVAKTLFREGPAVRVIQRGTSARPLYVTAAGIDVHEAAGRVVELHGSFRIPTLLKRVDRLCRGLERCAFC
ncbi:MAG TPA: endonuclease V [Candidatus Eisenbacteria bacterium]|nr:endonuclease V [Candidatus Eisenbacteria bacterium]